MRGKYPVDEYYTLANPDKRVPSADEIRSKAAAYCLGKEAGWKN